MVKIFYNIEAPHIEFSSHIFGCKHHFPKHDVVIRSRICRVWAKQSVTRATTDATAICAHQKSALGAALSESRPSSNKTLYSAYDGTWRPAVIRSEDGQRTPSGITLFRSATDDFVARDHSTLIESPTRSHARCRDR